MKAVILLFLLAVAASAHHSFDAEFDRTKQVSLIGCRHESGMDQSSRLVLDQCEGRSHGQACELGMRDGKSRTRFNAPAGPIATMKEGMIVSLTGSRAKDGSNKCNTAAVLVDGKRLGAASSGQ